ncbi:MAG: sulfotransferase [Planctomycetota bacterium]
MFDRTRMIRAGARVLSPLLKMAESRIYSSVGTTESSGHFPVFILGAPRTGSTVLYQMLTDFCDCLYIDNLVYAFSNDLPFGFWLSNRWYGNRGHNSFQSTYGRTKSLHSPSECGAFWYRWFPRDRDFVERHEIDDASVDQMRKNLYTVMNHFQKSIVIKNLNAGQRLRVLGPAFPKSRFVFIRRDPFFTIQSLLRARQSQGMKEERWWSVRPKNFEELKSKPLIEKLTGQVFFLEKQIVEDLAKLPDERVFRITYSRYEQQFPELLNFLKLPERKEFDLSEFNFQNKISVSEPEEKSIRDALNAYDWSALGYE